MIDVIGIVFAGYLLGTAAGQDGPLPAVRYEPPTSGTIQSAYDCKGQPVLLTLSLTATSVQVSEYKTGEVALPKADLDRWNEQLRAIRQFDSFGFVCQGGDYQAVSIRGVVGAMDSGISFVTAEWRRGRLFVRPASQ